MEHEFIRRDDDAERFEQVAADFCAQRSCDYRFLATFRQYQGAYSATVRRDLSFLVRRGSAAVALVYLPLEERDGLLSVTIGGGYVPAPVTDDTPAERAAFGEIWTLARNAGAAKLAFHACGATHDWSWNRLRAYGFIDTSTLDAVIKLSTDERLLWQELRKSYKALINKFSNANGYRTSVIDAGNPDEAAHEHYRQLHAKAAGRVTRDKASFDAQFRMLREGHATLLNLHGPEGLLGCAYFLHHGRSVDYFSMADDPALATRRLPISHVLIWAAVRHFGAKGFGLLRLSPPAGFTPVEGFGDYAEIKALAVAHFKHGMASRTTTMFRGIRYFDERAFARDADVFRMAVMQALKPSQCNPA
ncbi:MAG: GNAT family N-acetyltransferase [Alphaproteobacteria bacterium]|nr:GNAT family N-acetyltransferase [Alphaproteobacteria bacterium]